MNRSQTIWMTIIWGAVVAMMIAVVATRATRSLPKDPSAAAADVQTRPPQSAKFEPLFDAPDFQLTDQHGKPFTNKDLLGKVWVADFIFTQCGGPCPRMTAKLAQLSKAVTSPVVRFVSFSVDPEHDTPEVLKEYAGRYDADQSRWTLLTGPKGAMFDVAHGMRIAAAPATADEPIMHSTRFLVVDRAGKVIAIYDSNDPQEMKQLVDDLNELGSRH